MENTQATSAPSTTPSVDAAAIVNQAIEAKDQGKVEEKKPDHAEEDKSYSSKLQHLARQERKMREAIEKERADMEAKFKAEKEAWLKEREEKPASKKKNPIQALMDAGYTYAQATEYVMEHGVPGPEDRIKEVESKFEKYIKDSEDEKSRLAKEREDKEIAEREEAKKRESEAVTAFKEEIKSFLESNHEKYELTHLYGQSDEIYNVMDGYYQKTGKILSKDEAAEMVEKELESLAEKATKTKKFSTKYGIKEFEVKDDKSAFSQRTLSNSAATTVATAKPHIKTEEERRRNAMAILDGLK